jgi:hypothetical protein
LDADLIGPVDSDPEWETGSGSRLAKINHNKERKEKSKDVSIFSLASSVA